MTGGIGVRYDVGQIALAVFLDDANDDPDHVFVMNLTQAKAFDRLLVEAIRKAQLHLPA